MEVHPTSARLLRTTLDLLEAHDPDDVTVDMVLSASGVSKGSLYHHYRDFNDLLDRAQVLRFGRDVDDVIILSTQVIARSTTVDQIGRASCRERV